MKQKKKKKKKKKIMVEKKALSGALEDKVYIFDMFVNVMDTQASHEFHWLLVI